MRLDLADRLRCPRAHAPSPLIVVASQVDGRELVSGFAGCPVCHLEARIDRGVIRFPHGEGGASDAAPPVADDDLERIAALLGLDEPGGTVLLTGSYSRFAARLAAELDVAVVVVRAAPRVDLQGVDLQRVDIEVPGVCVVELPEPAVPFSDHTFRAAALDVVMGAAEGAASAAAGAAAHAAFITDAIRTIAVGGRVVGAAALSLPDDVSELARDDREWVGQRQAAASRVTLGRARNRF